jgi:D-amino-acid dehydrogenase
MNILKAEVAVIGSGVVGLCSALSLREAGYDVTVIDPNDAGSPNATSYGNAGTIAPYGVIPLGNPGVLRSLPTLLSARESPFSMRFLALPGLTPWLARFLLQSCNSRARANALALSTLLADALPSWQQLGNDIGLTDMMSQQGCLYLYRNQKTLDGTIWERSLRQQLGVRQEIVSPKEIAYLEPGLPDQWECGVYFPDAIHLADPGKIMKILAEKAAGRGVTFVRDKICSLSPHEQTTTLTGKKCVLEANFTVIAAGAWSKNLCWQAGDKIPLDTERGYHLEFEMTQPPVIRPCCPTDRGFYMTPMSNRLRVAGTVELGGMKAPANPRRLDMIERGVRAILPDLPAPTRHWLGFRPSMPDSLPVIGRSRASDRIFYAFGHGHLGLTLGPVTATAICNLLNGWENSNRLTPFRPDRFR